MVADPVSVSTGVSRTDLIVSEPSRRPRLSDLTWAAELEGLPYESLISYDEPYVVGAFRVLPRPRPIYRPGETLKMFYEIYDAKPPFKVSYQLEGREADGSWVSLGQPLVGNQSNRAQGWELPTAPSWPVGEYRVNIEVEDSEGQMITGEMPFSLEGT